MWETNEKIQDPRTKIQKKEKNKKGKKLSNFLCPVRGKMSVKMNVAEILLAP